MWIHIHYHQAVSTRAQPVVEQFSRLTTLPARALLRLVLLATCAHEQICSLLTMPQL